MLQETVPYADSRAGSAVDRNPRQRPRFGVRLGLGRPAWRLLGRYVVGVLALAAAYYGAAKLGYVLEFSGPVAAVVWLPSGVGIAFLALGGLRFWPGALVGDLLANDYALLPLGSALGQTAGNMAEVLVGALLIRRLAARGSPLDSLGGLARLLAAIAAATAISATVGPLSLRAGGVVSGSELPEVMRTWWLGDATGALIVIPLALAWYQPPPRGWARSRAVEGVLMLAAVAGMSEIAFTGESPLAYLVFPALGWAALRFGRRGATLAIAVAAGFAIWKTTHFHGPFVYDSITLSVLTTQAYIAVAALSTLCLAALVLRARAVRRGPRRLPGAARQGGGHRAPATRAQPPRRRPTAPHRARRAARTRRRSRARGCTNRAPPPWTTPGQKSGW